jgi:hypothetical protein
MRGGSRNGERDRSDASSPFLRSRLADDDPCTKSSDAYPAASSSPSAGDAPPLVDPADRRERFPMLALLRIAAPSVSRTPKILTPRLGHVRELCPLWLQCEHRRVISPLTRPPGAALLAAVYACGDW